jgi:hypothetical protein
MAALRKRLCDSGPTAPPKDPGAAHRISCQSAKALMGTAAAGSGQERPGDGVSPGARPADQITPEPPEERFSRQPGRAGATQ